MSSLILENFIPILILFSFVGFFLTGLFLYKSDKGDGKRKKTGLLLLGGLGPLLFKDANRDLTKNQIYGFIVVVILIIGTLLLKSL